MEKLIIQEELKNCPGIVYFYENNTLDIAGRSIPENPELIFRKLDEWITGHFEKNDALDVNIQLEYINSGSSKYLYEILYEEDDEAMLELGEHYRDTAGIPLIIDMLI